MVGAKKWVPYVLLIPWGIGLIIFKIYPIINSLIISFFNYNLMKNTKEFVKFDNFINLFKDEKFINSMVVTFRYVLITVPLVLIISLFVAFVLNFKIKGIGFFRTAFYIPSILGANIAIAVFWRYLFGNEGLVNNVINFFGFNDIYWLTGSFSALIVISLLRVWQFGSSMIIFLAALKNVPESLYEAAIMDGASRFKIFYKITIPIITPVILFNAVMRLIEAFQVFNGPFMITEGGPAYATYVINVYIYETGFEAFEMGYASAMSWVLFILIMILTLAIFRSSRYWVHYSD